MKIFGVQVNCQKIIFNWGIRYTDYDTLLSYTRIVFYNSEVLDSALVEYRI